MFQKAIQSESNLKKFDFSRQKLHVQNVKIMEDFLKNVLKFEDHSLKDAISELLENTYALPYKVSIENVEKNGKVIKKNIIINDLKGYLPEDVVNIMTSMAEDTNNIKEIILKNEKENYESKTGRGGFGLTMVRKLLIPIKAELKFDEKVGFIISIDMEWIEAMQKKTNAK